MASTFRDIIKYNPYHDERGRFSSGPGASVGMGVGGAVAGGTRTQLESTLQEVEAKNKGLDHEVATIVNPKTGKTIFSKEGEYLGIGVGKASCLLKEVKECVERTNIPLEISLKAITSNPADALKLANKGRIAVGKDADFVLLSEDLVIDTVIAKGQTMVVGGEPIVWGTFEEKK